MAVQICEKSVYVDGEKLDLMSGEVHYWRLERGYWKKVLDRLIEAGLGMVATYVPWRVHMPVRGRVDFATGSLNLRAFLELADTLGLKVFLRPGPLIVSEMECGGLPDYLFEDDDILARNAAGDISRGGICFSHKGVVSYLHPRYLDYVREWLSAVHEVVWDFYHQNGGPITILQLDNEVSYVCRDAIFESDYNEIVVGKDGLYQQWLNRKYGTSLPYPYTGPPRELPSNLEENLAIYLDWVEFKEDLFAEYLSTLRRMHEDLGVRDILYAANFNPHNAVSVPTNWAKMERAASGVTGYDFYKRPFMSFRDWARMALVCTYADAVMRVPWSPEFMCGIWGEDFGDGFGAVPAEHLEFMSLCAFAFGLKGLNYYMFAEREEWSFCPVNQFGQKDTPLKLSGK